MSGQVNAASEVTEGDVVFADQDDGSYDDDVDASSATVAVSFEEFTDYHEVNHAIEIENKLLRDDLDLSDKYLTDRTDALLQAMSTIESLRAEKELSILHVAGLTSKLSKETEMVERLSKGLLYAREEGEVHSNRSRLLEAQLADATTGTTAVLAELASTAARAQQQESLVHELERQLASALDERTASVRELQAAESTNKRLEVELASTAARAQQQESLLRQRFEHVGVLEKDLSGIRDDKICLMASIMELEATVKRLETDIALSTAREVELGGLLRRAKEEELVRIKRVIELENEMALAVRELTEQLATKSEKIDEITAKSHAKLSDSDASLDVLKTHVNDLRARLAAREEEAQQSTRKQSELISRIHDFEIDIFEFHRQVAEERSEHARILRERDSLKDASRDTADEMSLLTSQIKRADAYVADLESKCRRSEELERQLSLRLEEREQAVAALSALNDERSKVDEQSIFRITQLMERSATSEAKAMELSLALDSTRKAYKELEDASTRRVYDMESLRSENAAYRANEIRYQKDLETSRRDSVALQRQLEEEFARELNLRDRCRELEADNAKYVEALKLESTYEQHFTKLNSELEEKISKTSALRVGVEELLGRRQQAEEEYAVRVEEHRAGIGRLTTDVTALRAKADFYEQHHVELEDRIRRSRTSVSGLEGQEVALIRAVEELKRQERDLEIHISSRNAALAERTAACGRQEEEAAIAARNARAQLAEAQKESAECLSSANIAAAQLAESQRQLQAVRDSVAEAADEIERRRRTLSDLRQDEKALRDDISTFRATLSGIITSNEEAAGRAAAMSGEEDALRSAVLALKDELISCQRALNGVNGDLNSKKAHVDREEMMLRELLQKRLLAESDIRRLADLQSLALQAIDDDNRRRETGDAALRKVQSDTENASDALRLLQREVVELARVEQASRAVEAGSRRAAEQAREDVSRLSNEAVELRVINDRLKAERFDLEDKANTLGSSCHKLRCEKERLDDEMMLLSAQRRAVADTPAAISSLRVSSGSSAYSHCSSDYLSELDRRVRGLGSVEARQLSRPEWSTHGSAVELGDYRARNNSTLSALASKDSYYGSQSEVRRLADIKKKIFDFDG